MVQDYQLCHSTINLGMLQFLSHEITESSMHRQYRVSSQVTGQICINYTEDS